MKLPLVSVLIPSYNHEKYVLETLESILVQDYANIEIIIVDDGSKDRSIEIIQGFIGKYSGKTSIRFLHRENRGLAKTLNELIGLAQGEYLVFFASDDTFLPGAFSSLVEFAQKNSSAAVVGDALIIDRYSKPVFVTPAGDLVGDGYAGKKFDRFNAWRTFQKLYYDEKKDFGTYDSLLVSNYIPNGVLIRKDVVQKVGLFDEALVLQDHEYWLRLCRQFSIQFIPKALTNYRLHGDNSIFRLSNRILNDLVQILIREHEYCKTLRRRLLWNYAFTVVLIRMILIANLRRVFKMLHEVNIFVFVFLAPFVGIQKLVLKMLR